MLRRLATVLAGACALLTLAGCGGKTQTKGSTQQNAVPLLSVAQVRQAFRAQGIRLRRSSHETERAFGVEVLVFEAANAGPYFRVRVYPVEPDSFVGVSVTSVWTKPGQPEPVLKWADRRNVSVEYDANRPVVRGKIMAALDSLTRH